MIYIITQMLLCLIIALFLGFIFGWILSTFIKNEKLQNAIEELESSLKQKNVMLSNIQNELEAKDEDLQIIHDNLKEKEKELLIKSMDLEECQKNATSHTNQVKNLNLNLEEISIENESIKAEIETYKEQIKEYQKYEQENDNLKEELNKLNEQTLSCNQRIKELEEQLSKSKNELLTLKTRQNSNLEKLKNSPLERNTSNQNITLSDTLKKDDNLNNDKIASFGFDDVAIVKLIKETFERIKQKKD